MGIKWRKTFTFYRKNAYKMGAGNESNPQIAANISDIYPKCVDKKHYDGVKYAFYSIKTCILCKWMYIMHFHLHFLPVISTSRG